MWENLAKLPTKLPDKELKLVEVEDSHTVEGRGKGRGSGEMLLELRKWGLCVSDANLMTDTRSRLTSLAARQKGLCETGGSGGDV